MKYREIRKALIVFSFLIFFIHLISGIDAKSAEVDASRVVQVQYLRSEFQEEHILLGSLESISYSISEMNDGLVFASVDVQLDSSNKSFLRDINMDLYIESYDYFGSLGAWSSNNSFTITNPSKNTQELFLKIQWNYIQTSYVQDIVAGNQHTINFTSGPAANRIFVRWSAFVALKFLEINQSVVDFSNADGNPNSIRTEFLPNYLSFQLPNNQRIEATYFLLKLEEKDLAPPSGECYISAIMLDHEEIVLNPNQEFLFKVPNVVGWSYLAAAAYTNLTLSLYPQPYPFQLIGLSTWDSNASPLLMTALDTNFGVKNISNETYRLNFDILYYFWQNQTGLTYSHEIVGNDTASITHKVSANVSQADIGVELGLIGQYLRFQVSGKTIKFDAPDPVGKYEKSYIPLKQGSYILVTKENRILQEINSEIDDFSLSNKLNFHVTYDGYPFANAEIEVTQIGTLTRRTYFASTDQFGNATVIVDSKGPEFSKLEIKVSKDEFNVTEKEINYFIGTSWIVIVIATILSVAFSFITVQKWRKHKLYFTKKINDFKRLLFSIFSIDNLQ